MMEPELKLAPRAMRFLFFTPATAIWVLWAVYHFGLMTQPWMAIRFLCKDLWEIALQVRHPLNLNGPHKFAFNGMRVTPGWRWFPKSAHYLSHDWKDSLMIAGALLAGGIVAVILDKIVIHINTQTMRSIK
ncbi:MAG: hypothetical protein ACYCR3_13210 [Acidithiobacillus sp.]